MTLTSMTLSLPVTLRRLVALAILAGLVLSLSACGDSNASSARKMDVKDPRLVRVQETGDRSFSGILVNGNSQAVKLAQVSVALYGASGTRIGTSTIQVQNVPANGEKKFSGPLDTDVDVAQARVRSITIP